MKILGNVICALSFAIIPAFITPAAASSASAGYISNLNTGSGVAWFTSTGAHVGTSPACATSSSIWILDSSTTPGQSLMAAVLTASARQQQISIVGKGTCLQGLEEINYISVIGQ